VLPHGAIHTRKQSWQEAVMAKEFMLECDPELWRQVRQDIIAKRHRQHHNRLVIDLYMLGRMLRRLHMDQQPFKAIHYGLVRPIT
jgi:hypothetical protein